MNLTMQPHPAARQLLAEEAERAAREERSPDFTEAKQAFPHLGQEIMDGKRRIGFYGGYGPGHGLSIIVYLLPHLKEEVIAFVAAHPEGGQPGKVGMVPPPAPPPAPVRPSSDEEPEVERVS